MNELSPLPVDEQYPDPPADAAFEGLAGDVVRALDPHTESDPVAVLTQFITMFGNCVNRSSFVSVEASRHTTNIFICLVGGTGTGRKGTSNAQAVRPLALADPEWAQTRIQSGLSSGEGLVWAVRDPIDRKDPVKDGGKIVGYEIVIADHGIDDKRLLATETEFSSVLKVAAREGNLLTNTIRQAWDSGSLRLMTKTSPAKSTDAHISIIGHITKDELLHYMAATEIANGFANRFLWCCVKRSKLLPEGGNLSDQELGPIVSRLRAALDFSRKAGELTRDEEARDLWRQIYESLSSRRPGLLGAATSRAEAQVVRLSLIYALLDCSPLIRVKHLRSALALWRYCEASARFIFGERIGDPVSDKIVEELRAMPDGLTRTELNASFGRNRTRNEIDGALVSLIRQGLIHSVNQPKEKGRPVERLTAVRLKTQK